MSVTLATLYLVGVGPGEAELLTLKAVRILRNSKLIAYGQKENEQSIALNIVKDFLPQGAKTLPINIPMKIEREPAQFAYDAGAKQILKYLRQGKDVTYICEGDALFYGSAIYLLKRMPSEIEIKIIAGISSPHAASASLKMPLARRNEILKTLPATLSNEELLSEIKTAKTIALIKVGRHFLRIKNLLKETGFGKNAFIVENASCENEKIIKLSDYSENSLPYFAIILAQREEKNCAK